MIENLIERFVCWFKGEHLWGSWLDFENHSLRICFRCGEQEERRGIHSDA